MSEIPTDIFKEFGAVSEAFGKLALTVSKSLCQITPGINKTVEMVQASLSGLSNTLAKVIQAVKDSAPSKEEIQKLLEIYAQWGEYGWTIHPLASIDYYDTCPDNYIEADKYALKICTNENTNALLNMLRKKNVPKKDFEEAVTCYNNKCYKSCSMLMFSMLDREMIRLQKKDGEKNLKTGSKGVKYFKDTITANNNTKEPLFYALRNTCLIISLEKHFENAHNFTLQTNLANRNLVDHGMANNPVRKKDCLKLFLLLYNLLEWIDE